VCSPSLQPSRQRGEGIPFPFSGLGAWESVPCGFVVGVASRANKRPWPMDVHSQVCPAGHDGQRWRFPRAGDLSCAKNWKCERACRVRLNTTRLETRTMEPAVCASDEPIDRWMGARHFRTPCVRPGEGWHLGRTLARGEGKSGRKALDRG